MVEQCVTAKQCLLGLRYDNSKLHLFVYMSSALESYKRNLLMKFVEKRYKTKLHSCFNFKIILLGPITKL